MRGALHRWSAGWLALLAISGTVLLSAQQSPPQQPPQQTPATQQPADQQQPERAQQPPIRTGINFVRVDVIVSDGKGQPVTDLKAEDFSVAEDGKPQKIESFTLVKIDNAVQAEDRPPSSIRNDYDEEREAARPDVRLFVILLDDYHVRLGNSMAVRKPLTEFIQNSLGPADMVALMYPLTPVADIRFSRDRNALISAIEKFEGRKFDYRPRNVMEERYAFYPAAIVERIRNQLTMGALKAAAFRMGGLREGRKSIIFVSEGFTATLPPQLNDPVSSMPGLGNPARGRTTPDSAQTDRAEFFNTVDLNSDMRDVFDVANRQNTSIYPVDPRGLGAFEYDINEVVGQQTDRRALNSSLDTLRVLADNTDGRAILNRNDLAVGMRQIIRDASAYYLLGYTSTQAPTDGKFHKIDVKVTRRGLDIRARKGYWAYTADDAARALAPPAPEAPSAVTAALNAMAEPARGRPARFWIGTSKGENGRTRVTFAWERIAAVPGDRRESEPAARVVLNAMAPDGRPIFRGRVPEDGADGGGSAPPSTSTSSTAAASAASPAGSAPAGSVATFEAPPGQLQLRITVEGARGQVIDSLTRELTLPDFTKVEVTMGTPRVFRGRTVRDIANIRANPGSIPTADREFSRAERLLIRVDAYTPGGITPKVTARLLNRTGQKMSDLPVQVPEGGGAELELPLSALPAGDYLIELNAAAESGTAQEMIAFRIGR
ncbi:MAG: VWA domain-containing protein [Vicinamibacterales bacterium]